MQLPAVAPLLLTNARVFWPQVVVAVSAVAFAAAAACRRVHSSVVRAADCSSAGPWFKSGCALTRERGSRTGVSKAMQILQAGLEPAIPSLGGKRLIHQATRASDTQLEPDGTEPTKRTHSRRESNPQSPP